MWRRRRVARVTLSSEGSGAGYLRNGGIDVFVQDLIRDPESMGGWKLLEIVQSDARTRDIPTVVVTNTRPTWNLALQLERAGACGYVYLPCSGTAIVDAETPGSSGRGSAPGPPGTTLSRFC